MESTIDGTHEETCHAKRNLTCFGAHQRGGNTPITQHWGTTLPQTNSEFTPEKLLLGILSRFLLGAISAYFQGRLLLVSGRVYQEPTYAPKPNHQIIQDQPGHFKTSNVPWSFGCRDLLGMGDRFPTFNDGNPYNGYISLYYWVDEFMPYYMEIMGL